uniref:Uncharacterized protein n=1 Tax=Corethron hystrix TaxID=216773 RepID=A0A6U5EBQ2_9STRA|mmetsp:Transcript_16780/g.37730  ORF Transcript_16780/g.37730 Transcript_16780/m.37730 type:complete len:152 (+) Transcript_16780:142-597(+)|eukprot:CAMPEP_0113316106 /NCGR_PEP_ID=MMETSP0010_2-20120614/11502_1 /TAXON_ID=216773 ORGANISM="Corethron hystrix, Strain 308" /NCGR_SAMPLE_ID=MMETSP0010_2 /ASSEMBLY_ACC=CAM_ASM_000155 /LENGTH=151 /DNA_ID=CAMNT_0000172731 /DNA_START=96 /DNA_END=551 /DNA_ORIENTATION=+ /assembly_acc=CAM_ASM_000155
MSHESTPRFLLLLVSAAICHGANAFLIQQHSPVMPPTTTALNFGIPDFSGKKENDEASPSKNALPKEKIGLGSLLQLITAGMGSPFLGDYEGVDKETGNFMFSLEANNLVDEDGKSKQTSMPYFESGWVDEEEVAKAKKKKEEGGGFKLPW